MRARRWMFLRLASSRWSCFGRLGRVSVRHGSLVGINCVADCIAGMERHETLHALKQGAFPTNFSDRIGDPSGKMEACVREMLMPDHPSIEELKQRLCDML